MKEALELTIEGIKCDIPDCDFEDPSVSFDNYQEQLNRPCPKCGANLLTEADLETINLLVDMAKDINTNFEPTTEDDDLYEMSVIMDGSGNASFETPRRIKNA